MWIAFATKQPHRERMAGQWLADAGFRVALPEETYKARERHGARRWRTTQRLALPGYVFVLIPMHMTPGDLIAKARAAVACLGRPVGINGKPLLLPANWVDRLILDRDGLLEPEYRPAPGEAVYLTGVAGVMDGYRGRVEAVSQRDVRVIIEALHRALAVTVPIHAVRKVA